MTFSPMPIKILFLEDEETLGRIYTRHMTEAGFDVSWAQDIPTLNRFIEMTTADIVILDHGVQDETQDGLDLIPSLKRKLPHALFIMLTNFSPFHLEKKALKVGADAYYVKLTTPPPLLIRNLKKLLLEKHGEQGSAQV